MPGIVGIITRSKGKKFHLLVNDMAETICHEDFYRTATFNAPDMGIYAAGAALEKSFADNPVLFNEDRSIVLIFAGECVLDPQVGADLKTEGHLVLENKASWLPHLYEAHGESFFERLNGIFSGLLIDRRRQKAFLFNDRYGLSRIYIHESNGNLYFASEAKALLRVLPELRCFDRSGVAEFLACGCPLDWKTIFNGINILPGGSCWTFENSTCKRGKYFSPDDWKNLPELQADEFESQFKSVFRRILPAYCGPEGQSGIALTAGLDTRMIMACRPESDNSDCYTFTGQSGETLDDIIAARVAKECSLEHQLLRIPGGFFSSFGTHVDRTVFLTDGSFGLTGAHEVYLNKLARQIAPTRLTGVFGGEILRGVSTFKPTGLARELVNAELHDQMDSAEAQLLKINDRSSAFAAFCEVPWSLFGSMKASASQVNFRSPYLDNELVRLAHQIPRRLRGSSIPAVNLIRESCPRLGKISTDMGVFGSALNRLWSKVTFKLDYICNDGLPRRLSPFDGLLDSLYERKIVFGKHKFLRYRRWLRRELSTYLKETFASLKHSNSIWNGALLERIASDHLYGRRNRLGEINAVITLDAVKRTLFRDLPLPDRHVVEIFPETQKTTRGYETLAGACASDKNKVLT